MNAAALIARFSTGTYTVTRRAASTYTAGRVVAGATSTTTITASVQNATGRDLMRLPEGRRSFETCVIYTTTELRVGQQGGSYESDLVTIDGVQWEVQSIAHWPAEPAHGPSVPYYRAIAQAPA